MPSLRPLCCLLIGLATLPAAETTVTLTGRQLSINGQSEVPRGMFGVHAVPITAERVHDQGIETHRHMNTLPAATSGVFDRKSGEIDPVKGKLHMVIDCQGDRYQVPMVLRGEGWKEQCARIGHEQGMLWKRITAATGQQGVTQWWNEAYLNWAERSAGNFGSTLSGQYYDTENAVEGGPVTIKGWDEPLEHFRWRRLWPVRKAMARDHRGKVVEMTLIGYSLPMPEGAKAGDTFMAKGNRYWLDPSKEHEWTVVERWIPVDITNKYYWSGKQNYQFYEWTFGPWAEALRKANPEVTILAGWDWHYGAGNWDSWFHLYRPLLKKFPGLIDGLTEHHYGVPPKVVQTWYAVGSADAWAITGRKIRHYNTECQGVLDPAVYGRSSNAVGPDSIEKKVNEARYNLEDTLGLIARMPDKAASRTAHNFAGGNWDNCGAAWALRLMKPLRGPLLEVDTDDPRVYAIAAWRPKGQVALALHNANPDERTVSVKLPELIPGRKPKKGKEPKPRKVTINRLVPDGENLSLGNEEQVIADGMVTVTLASQDTAMVIIPRPVINGKTQWEEVFADQGALITPDVSGKIPLTFGISAGPLRRMRGTDGRLKLRLVLLGTGTATVSLNGTDVLALSQDLTIAEHWLDADNLLPGINTMDLDLPDGGRLGAASLFLEMRE